MDKSAIIIAVDSNAKFGEDKAFLKLDDRPLLSYVIKTLKGSVEEIIVVVTSVEQTYSYREIVPAAVRFEVCTGSDVGSLAAATKGLEGAQGKYSLVLPFDSPFVSKEVLSLLFELSPGKSAVVPRWPNSECEPLHAVYNTSLSLEASRKAMAAGETDLISILGCLHGVRYVSTLVIEQLDPDFRSFFRVKTPLDLKKAAVMIKSRKHQ